MKNTSKREPNKKKRESERKYWKGCDKRTYKREKRKNGEKSVKVILKYQQAKAQLHFGWK